MYKIWKSCSKPKQNSSKKWHNAKQYVCVRLKNLHRVEAWKTENRGCRPSWGPKGRKWRPQADNMAKIKRTGRTRPVRLLKLFTLLCGKKHRNLKQLTFRKKGIVYSEVSDAVAQCKSHVGQLRSMLWIGYRYTWWHHVRIANSLHLDTPTVK